MYKWLLLFFFPVFALSLGTGLLRVSGVNPRYLVSADDTNKAVYLTGFHFWDNAIDAGDNDPPEVFPYSAYLDSMSGYGHNFIRLWAGWHNTNKVVEYGGNFWFGQNPYRRTGPGNANDGKLKFDLTSFDDTFFARMRTRCDLARQRGMYVAVQMFNGWVTNSPSHGFSASNPWATHPYNVANNINAVDGDSDNDGSGEETQRSPYGGGGGIQSIWNIQVAYMKRMIDELNDLDNIIWETSNEAEDMDGTNEHYAWSRLVIDTIHAYERRKPKQHLVWYTGDWGIDIDSQFTGPAACIAPGGNPGLIPWDDAPPDSGGRRVVIQDTDHTFGMLNVNGVPLAWKNFTSGQDGIVLQDNGFGCWYIWACDDPLWPPFKRAMGQTALLASTADLLHMTPQPNRSSTSNDVLFGAATGEVIVYQQTGNITVDLTGIPDSLNVTWYDPDEFITTPGAKTAGGASRTFTPPNARYDVLYLRSAGSAPASPALFSPSNGSTQQPLALESRWYSSSGANTYHYQLALNQLFSSTLVNDSLLADTTRQLSGLATGTTYYWRVRASNAQGSGPWSSVWSFSTLVLPPAAPVHVGPANFATGQSLTPALRWNGSSGASTYDVQLSIDPGFVSIVFQDSLLVDTTRQASGLVNSTTYHWRVRSRNTVGTSNWTEAWQFTTAPITNTYSVEAGWNLVSIALNVSDPRKSVLFPTAVSSAFAYIPGSGYQQKDSLQNGMAYWLKFPSAQGVSISGSSIPGDTISVVSGWNLIGSVSNDVDTSQITTIPAGIVTSKYSGYLHGYFITDSIRAGKGYWIKTNSPGVLMLNTVVGQKSKEWRPRIQTR